MKVIWVMNKQLDVASDKAYISIISRHLKTHDIEMTIVARYHATKVPYDGNVIYLPTLPIRLLKSLSYLFLVAIRIFSFIKQIKPDVIVVDRPQLALSFGPLLLYRAITNKHNPKIVLDVRSLPNDADGGFWAHFSNLIFNLGLKLAGRYFDGCMAITPPMAKYIVSNSSFNEISMGLWSSAFDESVFDPEKTMINPMSPVSPITTIIYHGTIIHNRMLLESISALKITKSNANMLILGDGPLLPTLKKLSDDLNLNHRVTFMDPVDYQSVPSFLKAADIGIVPIPDTLWFNVSMPIKLLEYMSMGLPIIAPLTSPVINVMADRECDIQSFKLSSNNKNQIQNIALAMDQAIDTWGKGYFSKLNRSHVINRFSWKIQSNNIAEYLNRIQNN